MTNVALPNREKIGGGGGGRKWNQPCSHVEWNYETIRCALAFQNRNGNIRCFPYVRNNRHWFRFHGAEEMLTRSEFHNRSHAFLLLFVFSAPETIEVFTVDAHLIPLFFVHFTGSPFLVVVTPLSSSLAGRGFCARFHRRKCESIFHNKSLFYRIDIKNNKYIHIFW